MNTDYPWIMTVSQKNRLTASRRRRRILHKSLTWAPKEIRLSVFRNDTPAREMRLRLRLAVKRGMGQWYVVQPAVLIPAKGETKLQVCFGLPSFSGFRST